MTEQDFEAMSRVELRNYLNSHRDDNRAWEAFFAKLGQDRSSNQNQWYPAALDTESIRITEEAIKQKIQWYPAPLDTESIRITEEAIKQKIQEKESA